MHDVFFQNLKQEYEGDFSYVDKVICDCKNDKFIIYKDNHPTVIAECCLCKKRIVIYDLSYYPAEWANPFIKRDQYDISCSSLFGTCRLCFKRTKTDTIFNGDPDIVGRVSVLF